MLLPGRCGRPEGGTPYTATVAELNRALNRLPSPFQVRCGLSAGEEAAEPGEPIGHLDSPVIDRAAQLQRDAPPGGVAIGEELAGKGLIELGILRPVDSDPDAPVFVWAPPG